MDELWTVGQVARMASTTVRTLHHYDDIGLLVPSHRDPSGYRRYDAGDVRRLQRILAYRAMGVDLEAVRTLLGGDPRDGLAEHLSSLRARIETLQQIERTLVRTMDAHDKGIRLTAEEMLEVFGDHDPLEHHDEAEQRWGETDAWAESKRRTSGYAKEDWLAAQAEGEVAVQQLLAAFRSGLAADSAEAIAGALAHRSHIDHWFYPCSAEMQCNLADMYLADERFRKNYDDRAEGFAQYVHDAIYAAALS